MTSAPLARSFYRRDPRVVAPELLNKVLVRGRRAGRIVEVEAYCGSLDSGSHAYRGRTNRNATMFGRPGLLYVYFTYGMHWCANAVCGGEGVGTAVLLPALRSLVRALRPTASDLAGAFSALRPQAPRYDRITAALVPCELAVQKFFQWTPSVFKFSDAQGAYPRGESVDANDAQLTKTSSCAGDGGGRVYILSLEESVTLLPKKTRH